MPRRDIAPVVLSLYTIYNSPSDYPGRFVVRRYDILHSEQNPVAAGPVGDYATLKEARASLPPWLSCVRRLPEDDPCIVETWL